MAEDAEGKEFSARILVVDDELPIRDMLREYLAVAGHEIDLASDGRDALQMLKARAYDLVITDIAMPRMGGIELLQAISTLRSPVTTILMTGFGTVDNAIQALRGGAYDYILKPFRLKDVGPAVQRALQKVRLERENLHLRTALSLYQLSQATTSVQSLEDLFEIYTQVTLAEVQADLVLHYMAGSNGEGFGLAATYASTWFPEDTLYRFAESMDLRRALEEIEAGRPLLSHGGDVDAWFAAEIDPCPRGLLAVPVSLSTGETVGLTVALSMDPAHRFAEGQRKLAHVFAQKVADAVEKTRLYDELARNRRRTLTGLANVLMTKDPYIRHHSESVRLLAMHTARALGLPEAEIEVVGYGGLLHDIGKVGIRIEKLHQKDRLSVDDFRMFKEHPDMARFILEPLNFLSDITPMVYHHHERWDGRGYPGGLAGEEIPLGARIVSVCDAYDAITSKRVYVLDTTHETAVHELRRNAGSQFDPNVVNAFCGMIDEYRATVGDYHAQLQAGEFPPG